MKYAFIRDLYDQHPIRRLCQALNVSRSGYYQWLTRKPSRRAQSDQRLLIRIRQVHRQSRENYGAVKTWKALKALGIDCGKHRVARLRNEHDLLARRRRRFVHTTRSKPKGWAAPNRLNRDFSTAQPNRIWVGDVTFVPTQAGWLYLAVLLDLYSRRVVGWSMSSRNNLKLVLGALRMAIQQRHPEPGLVHHTDRGRLYAAYEYRQVLDQHQMIPSMSRKKDCWDNAVAESFFNNLKNELVYHQRYGDRLQARAAIFDYIEVFYNRRRIHQTLGYQSPHDFELNNVA